MKKINEVVEKVYGKYPEKVLQIGEGNFLRAFADWMIEEANERGDYKGSILMTTPLSQGRAKELNAQNGLYTVVMRGLEDGKATQKIKKITSVSKCLNIYEEFDQFLAAAKNPELEVVISNTTEAGIAYKEGDKLTDTPPSSYPAKLTVFLYERYKAFNGDNSKGLLMLPCELIDYNGTMLKKYILQYATEWKLEEAFINWIESAVKFTNTLVDRIVTGYPKDAEELAKIEAELGYKDEMLDTCEVFNLWVIEGKKEWADIFPIHKGKANVLWTDDVKPYKLRKVRILNGGHTATVLAAYLAGHNIVLEFMNDPIFKNYLDVLFNQEVLPTINLPADEISKFAQDVKDRFANPFIKHALLDISLNSCSKFNARCMPTLLDYVKIKGDAPALLSFAMAAFIKFYQGKMEGDKYMGVRADGTKYQIKDSPEVIAFFEKVWQAGDAASIAKAVLSEKSFWSDMDLTTVKGLEAKVAFYLNELNTKPVADVVKSLTEGK
ncbi:tagaturonate reductase [Elusimicrobium posterum]|uniref:tagaturonate reductase n=1 Tax=Elusimicrobium posterum TaxID=3116653 RepID=UPI003C72D4B0